MGKIIKAAVKKNTTTQNNVVTQIKAQETTFTPTVVPIDLFDKILDDANILISSQQYAQALPLLLNLEITNFSHVGVHELLADVYLQLNQIDLAKEQCRIYADLLQQSDNSVGLKLQSFDELYKEAGDLNTLHMEFQEFQKEEITPDNFYQGTNIVLKIATHYMAQHRYQDAEKILTDYRDKYIKFLEVEAPLASN